MQLSLIFIFLATVTLGAILLHLAGWGTDGRG